MEQVSKMATEELAKTRGALDGPDPTPEMMATPEFEAVWQAIKRWDVERKPGDGYAGANGSDVRTILDALDTTNAPLNATQELAESFAKTVALVLEADPTRKFDLVLTDTLDSLIDRANLVRVEWTYGDHGPDFHTAVAEVLMAVAAVLAAKKLYDEEEAAG